MLTNVSLFDNHQHKSVASVIHRLVNIDGMVGIASRVEESPLAPGAIERVEALGSADPLNFKRTRKGLVVKLPEGLAGSAAIALKIRGN